MSFARYASHRDTYIAINCFFGIPYGRLGETFFIFDPHTYFHLKA